ncbi:MAG: hypothetical protein WDZ40_02595 [Candidatus Spechtbacterales bacterium]
MKFWIWVATLGVSYISFSVWLVVFLLQIVNNEAILGSSLMLIFSLGLIGRSLLGIKKYRYEDISILG